MGNTDPTLVNQLKEIDGYEDLFGSQNYCHCSHCKSIFGPAAYLVDLMYFIEKNISNNVFSTKLDHPLYLKNRRPDLWKLSLTCNNTNTPIPYLEMVNEVLEQYLETVTPRGNIYKKLSAAKNSIKLPFHKPLEELWLYLSHFELALPEILKLFKVEPLQVASEQLCLSQEELHAIVTPDYKGAVIRFGSPPSTTQMKVRDFLKYSGLTRDELDMPVSLKFIKGSGNLNIELEEKADDIQRFDERVVNLNRSVLDRIQRFIRMWRQVPWSMTELDLVLDSLSEANLAKDLKQEAVICIAGLLDIQKRLKMSVEELCALFYLIPNKPVKAGEPSLFERLFEQDELLGQGSYFNFYHAYFNKNNPDDKTVSKYTPGLVSGLGITQGELLLLLQFLRKPEAAAKSPGSTGALDGCP